MRVIKRILDWIAYGIIAAVCLGILGAGAAGYGYYLFAKAGPLPDAKVVIVGRNQSLEQIAEHLKAQGVIERPLVFAYAVRALGNAGRLRSGEYRFPKHASGDAVMTMMVQGQVILRRVTVPEGYTTFQALDRVRRAQGLDGEITVKAEEGDILPDTYTYTWGETRDQLVQRMKKAMAETLEDAWANREADLPLKDKRELLTLASIVEKETAEGAERARIAGVFVNRLRRGMRLETDPTVIYGITQGRGALGRRLLRSDLENPHPYNTYRIQGLPPGPIANPGKAALEATAKPAKHDEFYFVADGSGGHAFARTLEEHNRNVQRWRRLRQSMERDQ